MEKSWICVFEFLWEHVILYPTFSVIQSMHVWDIWYGTNSEEKFI